MPRKSSRSRSKSRSPFNPLTNLLPNPRNLRVILGKLRDVAVGLGLISAVSLTPQSIVEQMPPTAQQAMNIATDIRGLLAELGTDTADGLLSLLA